MFFGDCFQFENWSPFTSIVFWRFCNTVFLCNIKVTDFCLFNHYKTDELIMVTKKEQRQKFLAGIKTEMFSWQDNSHIHRVSILFSDVGSSPLCWLATECLLSPLMCSFWLSLDNPVTLYRTETRRLRGKQLCRASFSLDILKAVQVHHQSFKAL